MATHHSRKIDLNMKPHTSVQANPSSAKPSAKDYERMWRNIETTLDQQDADAKQRNKDQKN